MKDVSLRIEMVAPAGRPAALALLFSETEGTVRCDEAAQLMDVDAESASFLIGAFADDQLVGVVWAQPIGKDAALVSSPRMANAPPGVEQGLLAALQSKLHAAGRRFAQGLVADDADGVVLRSAGFQRLTQLVYLVLQGKEFAAAARSTAGSIGLHIENADKPSASARDAFERCFEEVVASSYIGTMDCPELNGIRSTSDTLEGYRLTGRYDPRLWLLAACDGEDVGGCAMTWHGEDDVELLYYGVVPAARGRGFGESLLRAAVAAAHDAGAKRFITAVDQRNRPAIVQYCNLCFSAWAHRQVFVKTFGEVPEKHAAAAKSSTNSNDES